MCKVSRLHSLFLCTLCGESLILHAVWLQASVGRFNPPISPPLDWKRTGCFSGSRHSWSSWIFRLQDLMQLLYQVSCKACCYSKLLVVFSFLFCFFAQNWNFVRLNKMFVSGPMSSGVTVNTKESPKFLKHISWCYSKCRKLGKQHYRAAVDRQTWLCSFALAWNVNKIWHKRTCCGVSFFVNTCLRICLLWNSHWLFISKDIETCQNGLKVGGESNVVEEILCA